MALLAPFLGPAPDVRIAPDDLVASRDELARKHLPLDRAVVAVVAGDRLHRGDAVRQLQPRRGEHRREKIGTLPHTSLALQDPDAAVARLLDDAIRGLRRRRWRLGQRCRPRGGSVYGRAVECPL